VVLSAFFSQLSLAQVDLSTWEKPKVFKFIPKFGNSRYVVATDLQRPSEEAPIASHISQVTVQIIYPFTQNLVTGITPEKNDYTLSLQSNPDSGLPSSLSFQKITLSIPVIYAVNPKTLYISSNYVSKHRTPKHKGGDWTSHQFSQLLIQEFHSDFGLGIGMHASHFPDQEVSVLPIIPFAWTPTPELRIEAWLPAQAQLKFFLFPEIYFQTQYLIVSEWFHLPKEVSLKDRWVKFTNARWGISAGVKSFEKLNVEIGWGLNLVQKLSHEDSSLKESRNTKPSSFVRGGILINY